MKVKQKESSAKDGKKLSLKDRMKADRARLKEGSGNNNMIYIKDGTLRVRILNVGEENQWYVEVIQFYLPGVKGVFSPATFGGKCALMDWYEDMKASKDEDDKALLQKVGLSRKYLVPVVVYSDDKGLKIDEAKSGKLLQLTKGLLIETMDYFLDEEWGDFTDVTNGYDIKYTREGKGKNDTTYSSAPCKPSKLAKPWGRKPMNLEEMVKNEMPSYEQTKEYLAKFLSGDFESEEEVDLESMTKKELLKHIKENDIDVKVTKDMSEKLIIKKIKRATEGSKKSDI